VEIVRYHACENILVNLFNPCSLLLSVCNDIRCLFSSVLNGRFPGLAKGCLNLTFTSRKLFFNFFFSGIEPRTHRHPGMIYRLLNIFFYIYYFPQDVIFHVYILANKLRFRVQNLIDNIFIVSTYPAGKFVFSARGGFLNIPPTIPGVKYF